MAYNANRPAELPPKNGSEQKTPAPVMREKAWGRTNFGSNGYDGASSTNQPGKTVTSPLADELKRASDDGESVLDAIIAHGTARVDTNITGQLRQIADGNVPASYGMRSRSNEGGTIPGVLTDDESEPVRQP